MDEPSRQKGETNTQSPKEGTPFATPSISLPKGGGAIRGIGEKFGVNPVTGTGSLSVPLASTLGRSDFGPQLSLSYDSGSGNGLFGFGWSAGLPAITRKTDKGLPRYLDGDESDVFMLGGAEDLVPILDGAGNRVSLPRTLHGTAYSIHLYRPRIEGLFARIERWTNQDTGVSHWRTITRDNIFTIFGLNQNSRISDPSGRRVFSYLIAFTADNKGNVTRYQYFPEDSTGIDLAAAHEANRKPEDRATGRHLKYIYYGNVQPYFPDWSTDGAEAALPTDWHFKIVFDYGDHSPQNPTLILDRPWPVRPDPFSSYRAGFEVRTYRRCERVLLFHNFPLEPEVGADCLVRSTDLVYSDEVNAADPTNPIYTFLESVTQIGYRRVPAGYDQRSTPPLEFTYSQPRIHPEVLTLGDEDSRENLPEGLDGLRFRWVDLDREGMSGILTTRDGGWDYKRNLSPLNVVTLPGGERLARAQFGPMEQVASLPVPARLDQGQQLLDLTGGGRLDMVAFDGPSPGFFERTADEDWSPHKAFSQLPRLNWSESNLHFVDLTGDGRADVLITEDQVFTFYPSLGEEGFGEAERVLIPSDEERVPKVVFADGTQTVSVADMSGDGLSDLVRVRNGEVCYWPNLGYGRFGAKVTMDGSPRFTSEEEFDPKRVRLVDIDGSGTADLLYIAAEGVLVCFNRSGNSWAAPINIAVFPGADNLSSVQAMDFLGNGTACLVWSTPLPGDASGPLRYVDLMGSQKPHLMARTRNNFGAETRLAYAPSTRFYLADKLAGRPWVTKLPFLVHVVERVETYDWIGRSRFVTRYTYHHGYFDGEEREFRGFGMVDQRDTEEHHDDTLFPDVETGNEDAASFNPPVLTRTWFHTGAFLEAGAVSKQYAHEYWVEPALRGDDPADVVAREALFVPDSVLDPNLSGEEMREAYRALKGSPLRIEVYAEDGTPRAEHPYTIKEQNYSVHRLQGFGPNQHAVLLTQSREAVTYHYERQDKDPRVTHDFTLEVDDFANVRRSVSVAYGRRAGYPEPEPNLAGEFRTMLQHDQTRLHVGATEHRFTAPVNRPWDAALFDIYRSRQASETMTAELTGIAPAAALFRFHEVDGHYTTLWDGSHDIAYEDVSTPDIEGVGVPIALARRITERSQTQYRSDDLTALLPLGTVHSLGLPGESYRLALTQGLTARIFGARVNDAILLEGGYVRLAGQNDWWIPSGRVFYSPGDADSPVQELAAARAHFYKPRRAVDPFQAVSRVDYDPYDLVPRSATDQAGNVTTARIDYRVLHPSRTTDPNGNFHEVSIDCLGEVTGTAVHGKAGEGDSLVGFEADLSDAAVLAVRNDPLNNPGAILGPATSRIVHDRFAYFRTRDLPEPEAPAVYTLTREKHVSDLANGEVVRFHHSVSYCDGFGHEVQHKAQAERGPIPGVGNDITPRWVTSGWTIYNNKGKPVRKFEPFFSATHRFDFNHQAGVSSVLFYDPLERVVATLHPDNAIEKTVFDAWREETWDQNDTVSIADPRTDASVGDFFLRWLGAAPGVFTSWFQRRIGGTFGDTPEDRAANQDAAQKTAPHAATPAVTHFDSLGRKCLSVADNGISAGIPQRYPTRTAMDTENKPLCVLDALGRRVVEMCLREPLAGGFRYVAGYDVAGHALYRNGMDGGERRTLNDAAGQPIRQWDARGFVFRTLYDALRRPTHRYVRQGAFGEILVERLIYGEKHPGEDRNLKGKLFRHYDSAGVASHDRYDFKNNPLETGRRLALHYSTTPDWTAVAGEPAGAAFDLAALDAATDPLLSPGDRFTSSTLFDAMNRPVQTVTPHAAGGRPSVIQPVYNEANLLEAIHVWTRRANVPAGLLDPATAGVPAISNIDYNAHGQRIMVQMGSGSTTTSTYDPETFHLRTVTTSRPHANADARTVQALAYTYDPKGNVTRLRDSADIQNVVYFRNQRVDPTADYTYDAIYRLSIATGREHLGLNANALKPPAQVTNEDGFRLNLDSPGDGNAVANYTERYAYDPVGNLLRMIHQVSSGNWTRAYSYAEPSRITPTDVSNRLSATSRPGDNPLGPYSDQYLHDEHGNMTRMPHLPGMTWDPHDSLQSTTRQIVNAGTPETTYYAYDAEGDRIVKATERQAAPGQVPTRRSQRVYLGPLEIYREYAADGTTVTLERETLHVLLDHRRMAMVETRTVGNDPAPAQLIRYQYGNHLSSAMLELDDHADVISYEEYFPYGSTSYQAVRSHTETPKRYRYTGKERDEENDLDYHGGRYCAPWLGRWTSCDPAGLEDGPNLYIYVNGNPVAFSDPTGMWGWREVAIVAAVVVVGTIVTVATAGVAGPIIAGAVASVGLSGAAATVATGVVVGAVAGAAGGAASELTRQVASGEQISGRAIGGAALTGVALGAVTGGLSAAASTVRGAAAISRASTAVRATSVGRAGVATGRTVAAGAQAVARVPGVRQVVAGGQGLGRLGTRALQGLERGSESLGIRASQGLYAQGSRGAQVVQRFAETRTIAGAFDADIPRVYRVQGGTPPAASRARISIGATGEMEVQGKAMLHVTFEDAGHSRYFLTRRPGAEVVSFEVDRSLINQVRTSAVRQAQARAFPGMPQIDDPTRSASAFGLPLQWHRQLESAAVTGSGRVGGLGLVNNPAALFSGAAIGGTRREQ
jgi:RHS repeat-associated protein